MDQVNRAQVEAEAILAKAKATAEGLAVVSQSLKENGGPEATSLRIAEQYIQAFSNIAKEVVAYKLFYMQIPTLHNSILYILLICILFTFSLWHNNVAS
ncbi:hypothetical protein RIF29_26676 [Crotalaria pallida]|uniref:STML2-like C-terminal extension domain-containing protein n=1 Tax=Crotalaria pallida TaxID=3830 RepID=A0AAN9EQ80_CROPI